MSTCWCGEYIHLSAGVNKRKYTQTWATGLCRKYIHLGADVSRRNYTQTWAAGCLEGQM